MDDSYEIKTECNAGFGWQFTVYKNGQLAIRRGTYETSEEARAAALRLMANENAPRRYSVDFTAE